MRRSLLTGLTAILVLAALAVPASSGAAGREGRVGFMLHATSTFDPYLTSSTPEQQQWMRERYERMRGYAPFFTWYAIDWAPPSHFYRDLLAIYNRPGEDGRDLIEQHPDWVLRDAQGNKLYVAYNCSGGSCPQYVADIGNAGFREWWIDQARGDLEQGYAGIHIDDVNMEMTTSNGQGNFVRPIDPRTGSAMTDAAWRRYVAEFTEAIRAAFPAAELAHNPLWWASRDDPYVRRQTAAADYIELERGFNDAGIGGGSGQWGFDTYLAHVDWLHSRGKSVIYEPKYLDDRSAIFELSSYLLVNAGSDLITTEGYRETPDDWWAGWETDLGTASGPRYAWNGLLRRDFSGGMALVNPPESPSRTVSLAGSWRDLSGRTVSSVTLRGREGAVLRGTGQDPQPTAPTPPSDGSTSTAPPTGDGPSTGDRPDGVVTLWAKRKRIARGRPIVLRGRARRSAPVAVQVRKRKGWRTLGLPSTNDQARFGVRVRVRGGRVLRIRARSGGRGRARVRLGARARGARVLRFRALSGGRSSRVVRIRVRPR